MPFGLTLPSGLTFPLPPFNIRGAMKASRLFVPLAEEYIQSGLLDEAISVLREGLNHHPNYLGARVSLGKVLLKKGLISEAVEEFEKVVTVSPDNLVAHKHLAHLYRELGRTRESIAACETILVFSPKDMEAAAMLTELLSPVAPVEGRPSPLPESSIPTEFPEGAAEEAPIDFSGEWEVVEPVEPEPPEEVFETETMADLYVRQGEGDRGAAIYRRILENDPSNDRVRSKLTDLVEKERENRERTLQIQRLESWFEKVSARNR